MLFFLDLFASRTMSQRTIAIRVDGGPTKHYTITNNKLSMKALQQYFRNACGLTYTKDDMEITVEIDFEGDYLKIDATVNAYTVCFATGKVIFYFLLYVLDLIILLNFFNNNLQTNFPKKILIIFPQKKVILIFCFRLLWNGQFIKRATENICRDEKSY